MLNLKFTRFFPLHLHLPLFLSPFLESFSFFLSDSFTFNFELLAALFPKGNTNGKLCSHHIYLIRTLIFWFSVLAFHWFSSSFLSVSFSFAFLLWAPVKRLPQLIIISHHLMQGTVFYPPGFGLMAAFNSSGFLFPVFQGSFLADFSISL